MLRFLTSPSLFYQVTCLPWDRFPSAMLSNLSTIRFQNIWYFIQRTLRPHCQFLWFVLAHRIWNINSLSNVSLPWLLHFTNNLIQTIKWWWILLFWCAVSSNECFLFTFKAYCSFTEFSVLHFLRTHIGTRRICHLIICHFWIANSSIFQSLLFLKKHHRDILPSNILGFQAVDGCKYFIIHCAVRERHK